MNPVEVLQLGAVELASILDVHGFEFVHTKAGHSSGGAFASGEFRRGDRRLELHCRHSLGMVRYHVGPDSLSHDDFTRAVLATTGATDSPRFPGFSDQPLEEFRHLAAGPLAVWRSVHERDSRRVRGPGSVGRAASEAPWLWHSEVSQQQPKTVMAAQV
jgi:hypothetical protein